MRASRNIFLLNCLAVITLQWMHASIASICEWETSLQLSHRGSQVFSPALLTFHFPVKKPDLQFKNFCRSESWSKLGEMHTMPACVFISLWSWEVTKLHLSHALWPLLHHCITNVPKSKHAAAFREHHGKVFHSRFKFLWCRFECSALLSPARWQGHPRHWHLNVNDCRRVGAKVRLLGRIFWIHSSQNYTFLHPIVHSCCRTKLAGLEFSNYQATGNETEVTFPP